MREQVMKINVQWICQKALIGKECVCWEAIKPALMKEVHCTVRLPAKYAYANKMYIVAKHFMS